MKERVKPVSPVDVRTGVGTAPERPAGAARFMPAPGRCQAPRQETCDDVSDFLLAMLLALAVLVAAFPVLRWAARAEKRAEDRIVMGRIYYPTRGRKADTSPFRRRRAVSGRRGNDDLDVDERDDRT